MRCYYLNFTNYRFNNCQEILREKRNMHLITSCTCTHNTAIHKITKLSTKRSFIEIYKYDVIEH